MLIPCTPDRNPAKRPSAVDRLPPSQPTTTALIVPHESAVRCNKAAVNDVHVADACPAQARCNGAAEMGGVWVFRVVLDRQAG